MKYSKHPDFCGLRCFLKHGEFYGSKFCYHEIPEKLDLFDEETFCKSPMEFYVTCTDIETGKPIYHKCDTTTGENIDWIRASASLPLVSKIVELDGMKLLDGGLSDSIPLKFFQSIGYKRNIVILTRHKDYVKEKSNSLFLTKLFLGKYKNMITCMKNRPKDYNDSLNYIWESHNKGETLVICPEEPLTIERIERDPEKLWQVYQIGRETGLKYMNEIKAFLAKAKSASH